METKTNQNLGILTIAANHITTHQIIIGLHPHPDFFGVSERGRNQRSLGLGQSSKLVSFSSPRIVGAKMDGPPIVYHYLKMALV